MSVEKATRLYEQSSKACNEVWQGHSRLQALFEVTSQGKGKDDPYFLQLPTFEKIRS